MHTSIQWIFEYNNQPIDDLSKSNTNKWERLRRILTNTQPCKQNRAIEVDYEICCTSIDSPTVPTEGGATTCNRKVTLFSMEYEQRHIPVKINGATDGWTCMPRYNENERHYSNIKTSQNLSVVILMVVEREVGRT